jgi:phosphoglucomutase
MDIDQLLNAYEDFQPDPSIPSQRVQFGTSGHRGSSLHSSFNRDHILAIAQSICEYRKKEGITGPIFIGIDTHALSAPAFRTTLEVLAANDVTVFIAANGEFTPTPVISHAILEYNRNRPKGSKQGLADGIILSPSHNPPDEGGFKYNPPHGGPAAQSATDWIQNQANLILREGLAEVKKIPLARAMTAETTKPYDFIKAYVRDLKNVIDMDVIRDSKIKLGVDPMGGAGVHFWPRVAEHYRLNLTVINPTVDPTFKFMTRDWDGKIRMDPSSPYAMRETVKAAVAYDLTFACDTDHDRHAVITPIEGLMPANPYLSVAIHYLFKNRPLWPGTLEIGKTVVSSQMIDRVALSLNRKLYEVPVGFKWFVEGLGAGTLGFAGEESAGASFLRKNGQVWTTDKDGMISGLLAAEMTARLGKNPASLYRELTETLGSPAYRRIEAKANADQKKRLSKLSPDDFTLQNLAAQKVEKILTSAPGNSEPIGGVKVQTQDGWFAARPSGTEEIYKIYAESFLGQEHLDLILKEAQKVVDAALVQTDRLD